MHFWHKSAGHLTFAAGRRKLRGQHAAGDQEGCCTKGANSSPSCQLLTAPQEGASSTAPQQIGIAQHLPFPASHQATLLWLRGSAPRWHSLPFINPGDPPPQHMQGQTMSLCRLQAQSPCPGQLLRSTRSCHTPPPDLSVLAFEAASASFKQAAS